MSSGDTDATAANGRISSAVDVMRDLVRRGINQEEFLPRTELGELTPAVMCPSLYLSFFLHLTYIISRENRYLRQSVH